MIKKVVFPPAEAAKLAIDALEELKQYKGQGVKVGVPDIDKVLLPLRPAELITVLGYTSWFKSGFMNFVARSAIKQCADDEIVIKVTWEDSIEEETLKWVAADASISITKMIMGEIKEWPAVMQSYRRRILSPLWLIGHSSRTSSQERRERPRLTMGDVGKAMEYILNDATDHQKKPKLIVLDYLQRIRPDRGDGESKRLQMMEAVNRAKDLGVSFGCPVMLGVQAQRGVLNREYKLPRIDDGLETSNIEQSSDKTVSLWYPIKTEKKGTFIESEGVEVNENLLIMGIL